MKKVCLAFFFLINIFFIFEGLEGKDIAKLMEETKRIDLYLFHSEECAVCRNSIPALVSKLNSMYPFLKIHVLDLKEPNHYEMLRHFENSLGRKAKELPSIVIGNHLLSGPEEIEKKLDFLLFEYFLSTSGRKDVHLDNKTEANLSGIPPKNISAELIYFSQSGCSKCGRTEILLHYLKEKYPCLSVKTIDLSTQEGKLLAEAIAEKMNLPQKFRLLSPAIIIEKIFLPPEEISEEKIEQILSSLSEKKENHSAITIDPEEAKKAEKSIIERFKSLGTITVALGGLIDGINPCAFATLIFLVSYLTMIGSQRGEILRVGLGFTGSVFISYFLIGIGLTSFIHRFSFTPSISRSIYIFASAFAIVMGILSFYDFIQWKGRKENKMKLQLPDSLKKLTHKAIRGLEFSKYRLMCAIFIGFVVSLFEFTCTGQVYLPTIIFVMGVPEFEKNALFYLLLYNFTFVIPILTVFFLFYLGITQRRFSLFLRKRGPLLKLFSSFFFLSLGILMFFTAF